VQLFKTRNVDSDTGLNWQFEPKWDGFRCLAYDLRPKSGKPLGRYFPEVVAMIGALPQRQFVVDGELATAWSVSASTAPTFPASYTQGEAAAHRRLRGRWVPNASGSREVDSRRFQQIW
jgi:ATP-dependent DNA ligase